MRSSKPSPPPPEATPDEPQGRREMWVLAAFAVGLALYAAAFFAVSIALPSGLRVAREELIGSLVLVPESWMGGWFGNGQQAWGLLDRAGIVLLALLLLGVAGVAGWLVLRCLRLDSEYEWDERIALSLATGLQINSLATLTAGLMGSWALALVPMIIVLLIVAYSTGEILDRFCPLAEDPSTPPPARVEADDKRLPQWAYILCGLVILPCVLFMLLGVMLPPAEFDVREYHLQVPKEWLQAGRIGFLPHNVYGNMPLGTEMQTLLAMVCVPSERGWWWGALAGKLVNAAWPLITALALFAAGRRSGSPLAGCVAAGVYLTLPWIGHVTMSGLNDAALAGYVWVALFAAFRGVRLFDSDADGAPLALAFPLRWVILAGWLAGGAASVKYTGLVMVLPPLLLLAAWNGGRWNWQLPLAFLLAAMLSCGLWYGKNLALTGNPVYPLAANVLGGATRTPERIAQWDRVHSPQPNADGERFSPRKLVESLGRIWLGGEFLSPVLWPLAMLGICVGRPANLRWVLVGGIVFLLAEWWFFTHRLERFWLPGWPLVAMLAGLGAGWGATQLWRNVMLAAVGVAAVFGTLLLGSPLAGDNRFFVSLEALRLDLPASPGEVGRLNPAHHWLNQHSERGILLVGDAQAFDLERPVLYSTCFDACLFEELTGDAVAQLRKLDSQPAAAEKPASELRQELHSAGIDYIHVHWPEIARYRSPGNYGFTEYVQPQVFTLLVKHNVLAPAATDLPSEYGQIFRVRPPSRPSDGPSGSPPPSQ